MTRGMADREAEHGIKILSSAGSATFRWRCRSCGLEWESTHDEEACPLRELEAAFLSEEWFIDSCDAIGTPDRWQ
jgi:rubrerythrin